MRIELNKASKIIIKLGSSIIDHRDDMIINGICTNIIELLKENKEVMLVTSGAISQGMKVMNVKNKPKDIKKLQSLAAVGQQKLMLMYEKIFSEHDFQTAQVLITHNDINDRVRYLNIKGTLEELLNNGVIPIINENDVVSTEEIKFGDNDNLASMIANLVDADVLIILTDQKGMYDKNPDSYKDAKLINRSEIGTGGFITKIQAAKRAALSNTYTVIANGLEKNILNSIFTNNNAGTLFIPSEKKISAKKQWLDTTDSRGSIIIDAGACKAICDNNSLLLVGVSAVKGYFEKGDVIQCMDSNHSCIAKGIVNYSSEDVMRAKGKTTDAIAEELGSEFSKELIHVDNLIVIET